MNQTGAIPEIVPGADLVSTINDRIRRINIALGLATTGAVGPRGPAGASGGGGGSGAGSMAMYAVPVGAGTATPDASKGPNLLILTAANTLSDANGNKYVNLAGAINYATSPITTITLWSLIVHQDPVGFTGGYSIVFAAGVYRVAFVVAGTQSPANTQSHIDFRTDTSGISTPTGSLIDQPI